VLLHVIIETSLSAELCNLPSHSFYVRKFGHTIEKQSYQPRQEKHPNGQLVSFLTWTRFGLVHRPGLLKPRPFGIWLHGLKESVLRGPTELFVLYPVHLKTGVEPISETQRS
jgi:hypothetical protein